MIVETHYNTDAGMPHWDEAKVPSEMPALQDDIVHNTHLLARASEPPPLNDDTLSQIYSPEDYADQPPRLVDNTKAFKYQDNDNRQMPELTDQMERLAITTKPQLTRKQRYDDIRFPPGHTAQSNGMLAASSKL